MKVDVKLNFYDIRVMVNGLPHVVIDRREYVGYQSYFENETKCTIEFYTKTNVIVCEYDSIEKWKKILKALNDKL